MPNLYATLEQLRSTGRPALEAGAGLVMLEAASRWIDGFCSSPTFTRHFFTRIGEEEYRPDNSRELMVDDMLAISALATDENGDGVYETVWDGYGYRLNKESQPSWKIIASGDHSFNAEPYGVWHGSQRGMAKVTGTFGYGDGESVNPWVDLGLTVTLATADAAAGTASAGGVLEAGMTIKADDEQIYISAVDGSSFTGTRGVNGTAAAAHAAAGAARAKYPAQVVQACLWLAGSFANDAGHEGFAQERMGSDYFYQRMDEAAVERLMSRALYGLRL